MPLDSTNPLVSVIIPNYNNACFIEQTIQSVYDQSYKNFECIIVDDGSTDESIRLIETLKGRFSSLSLIRQRNSGPSKARNTGVKHSNGELLTFLDADDIWKNDKLKNQVSFILNTGADIIASYYVWFQNEILLYNREINLFPRDVFDYWFDTPFGPSSIMIKKSKLIAIGGWDETLRACEDNDLWFRCAINNLNMQIQPIEDIQIRLHSLSAKTNHDKMFKYHIKSFQKWVELLNHYEGDKTRFCDASRRKLSRARYYAYSMKMSDKVLQTFLEGFRACGYKFFLNKLVIYQIFSALRNHSTKLRWVRK
ncbi:glycosyl transferase family protein [Flammeovirgaceae bacterium 311]|nr:glycosyl transferase family protein [Flammeovirgaceae bacterium 311]